MTRAVALGLLLLAAPCAAASAATRPRPEVMGVRLGMSQNDAHARLKRVGSLEREERKRQEVWAVGDRRVSHVIVGFDPDDHVRYVTAVARADGSRIRYGEVADVRTAKQTNNQGNYTFTWEVAARPGQAAYLVIAHGRDPTYLDSYSVKSLDSEEVE